MEPEKWRDTADPFTLPLSKFRLHEVLGYPHAGNDVFHAAGTCEGRSCNAFIKVERQTGADFRNEAAVLRSLPYPYKPRLLEYVPCVLAALWFYGMGDETYRRDLRQILTQFTERRFCGPRDPHVSSASPAPPRR